MSFTGAVKSGRAADLVVCYCRVGRGEGMVVCYLTGLHSHVWNLDASQFLLDISFITSGSNLVVVRAARFFVAIMSNIPFYPKTKIEIEKEILKNGHIFTHFSSCSSK